MIKALFTYDYGDEKMQQVRALGYDVVVMPEKNLSFSSALSSVEVLVCYSPFSTLDIRQMTNLRWIQLSSIGVDQVPIEAAETAGLTVTNNRGGYSVPIGEWIVLKILEIYKKSKFFYGNQLNRTWSLTTDVLELYEKRIGFIGTGTIAQEAAKRLKGFDVELTGFNTSGKTVVPFDQCLPVDMLEQWIHRLDVLVLAVPGTQRTEKLLGRRFLKRMKDSAVIVNISRGSVIDEAALLEQLHAGRFLGVALDVFESEPLSPDHPFWKFDRVYVTPHNCWVSEQRNNRRFEMIYANLKRYAEGNSLENVVNLRRGY